MFRGGAVNPYDDLVVKATDETQTSENWGLLIELCDKVVSDKSPTGPRDCVGAVQKRLQHRSANVQLYCMTLSEALVKNCGEKLQREIASRSFMNALVAIVTGRLAHDKVKKRVLQCLHSWAEEFKGNANLGLVEETEDDLKSKGFRHEEEPEPASHPSDDVLKREEEELQRALAESEREASWHGYGRAPQTGPSAGASTSSRIGPGGYAPRADAPASQPAQPAAPPQPLTTSFSRVTLEDAPAQAPPAAAADDVSLHPAPGQGDLYPMRTKGRPAPMRVRALYDFEPNEDGELAFKEGDVVKVLESVYKDWWKGELHGKTGIFPTNYVEPIPDPTPESVAREAEAEAAVFDQLGEIDRLLQMMMGLDAKRDNLADNDELSELYQKSLMLRPKIVRLIEKYTQKKAELLQVHDKFLNAKKTYDKMIEESLAKHHPGVAAESYTQPNPQYQQQYQHQFYSPSAYGPPPAQPGVHDAWAHQQQPYYAGQPQQAQQPAAAAGGPPTAEAGQAAPAEIDTSRYYLAADGNWYAYTAEQLASMGQQAPTTAAGGPATGGGGGQPTDPGQQAGGYAGHAQSYPPPQSPPAVQQDARHSSGSYPPVGGSYPGSYPQQ